MNVKHTSLATAISLALLSLAHNALAQQAPAPAPDAAAQAADQDDPEVLETIEVRGIRLSLEKSLEDKRASDNHVEVITAEEIGKMPDKNVADSLARVPGVTIQSQSGGSGGFDENDRVSLGVERAKVLARALKCHPAVLVFPGWDADQQSAA